MKVYILNVTDGFDEEPEYDHLSESKSYVLGIYDSEEKAQEAIQRASKVREEYDDRDYYGGRFLLYSVTPVELNTDDFSVLKERAD